MKSESLILDVCDLRCPILFVTVKLWLKKLQAGQLLVVTIDDKTGLRDVVSYLQKHDFEFTLTPNKHSQLTSNELTQLISDELTQKLPAIVTIKSKDN